jgi:hypothetical protein
MNHDLIGGSFELIGWAVAAMRFGPCSLKGGSRVHAVCTLSPSTDLVVVDSCHCGVHGRAGGVSLQCGFGVAW